MRESDVHYLLCPRCRGNLDLTTIAQREGEHIETAELTCRACSSTYPVVRFIPRFVPDDNYAANFGLEWSLHARTQYDSYSGRNVSEERFFNETRWPRDLTGQVILEVGSGSGRFTEQAARTGAFVVSMDYSYAVEANYQSNGRKPNVLIVQGDIYQMPFRPRSFDKLLCIGVLQHTPDVRRSFFCLPPMLRPGGELVIDVYKRSFKAMLQTKYLVRGLTRNMNPERLYRLTSWWIDTMWPLASQIRRLPRVGMSINWRLMIADHSNYGVTGQTLKEWAYLDTFDMLSPRYDSPQTLETVQQWFVEAQMTDIRVHDGYNGIEGHGRTALG